MRGNVGGELGLKLPSLDDKAARHTKPNMQGIKTERPNLRVVPKSQFQRIDRTQELVERLFGKLRLEQ